MRKISDLIKKLGESGIRAALISDELNIRYLIEMPVEDAYVFIVDSDVYLLTDFRYYEAATAALGSEVSVLTPKSKMEFILTTLNERGITSLAFEGNSASYAFYNILLKNLSGIQITDLGSMLETMRMRKTEDEIAKIQKSQDITDRAFSELLNNIKPDMTEIEVAAELEYLMRKFGSEGPAFSTIAVSGDASSLPHGVPRPTKLKKGFLTLDFGSKFDGYCSDMTRTIVIGKADGDMKKLYNTVLGAQTAALEYLVQGRDAGEADAVARRIIDADYPGTFGHSLGHAVGLLVHEMPALSPRSAGQMLSTGNIVTVEPGIYLYGKYGCRIEDMVAILDDSIHNFTHSTKELIEIL